MAQDMVVPPKSEKVVQLKLAQKKPNNETIKRLRTLINQAESGCLRGIAFAAIYCDRPNEVGVAGEAWNDPVYIRGLALELSDYMKS